MFTGDKFDNNQPANVKARRINADISEINVNPGGTLRVLLTAVNGTGQVNGGSGTGISISHNQKDFLMPGGAMRCSCRVPVGMPALMGSLSRLMARARASASSVSPTRLAGKWAAFMGRP